MKTNHQPRKKTKTIIISLLIISTLSCFFLAPPIEGLITSSQVVMSSGYIQTIQTSNFTIRAAEVASNTIKAGSQSYVPNWASVLHSLGVNTLRLQLGGEGDVWGTNMQTNPNWAQNLDNLLSTVAAAGFTCYWYSLGTPWGGPLFGNDQAANISAVMSLDTAKMYIDELAGNNSLHHDFITDPRYTMWSIANEANIGSSTSPNSNYYWIIGVADYIRSKGGLVTIASPQISDDLPFRSYVGRANLLIGHSDFYEIHAYEAYDLANYYKYANGSYNWVGYQSWLINSILKPAYTAAINAGFSPSKVFVGEFGMWTGNMSDLGLTNYYFSDQDRINYYTYYFQALNQVGIQDACFHTSFRDKSQIPWGDTYCMIAGAPYPPYATDTAGTLLAGASVIAANFGGT